MKSSFKAWLGRWARFTVCLLLLVWIFHAIFCNEAQLYLTATGENWDSLTKWDQRHLAWTL